MDDAGLKKAKTVKLLLLFLLLSLTYSAIYGALQSYEHQSLIGNNQNPWANVFQWFMFGFFLSVTFYRRLIHRVGITMLMGLGGLVSALAWIPKSKWPALPIPDWQLLLIGAALWVGGALPIAALVWRGEDDDRIETMTSPDAYGTFRPDRAWRWAMGTVLGFLPVALLIVWRIPHGGPGFPSRMDGILVIELIFGFFVGFASMVLGVVVSLVNWEYRKGQNFFGYGAALAVICFSLVLLVGALYQLGW